MSPIPLRFTVRDLAWLMALIVLAAFFWYDHRYQTRQLNFCIEALHQVEQELDQTSADSEHEISKLRQSLGDADRAVFRAQTEAAINAERPLPTPGPFIQLRH